MSRMVDVGVPTLGRWESPPVHIFHGDPEVLDLLQERLALRVRGLARFTVWVDWLVECGVFRFSGDGRAWITTRGGPIGVRKEAVPEEPQV